jgi:hypothetical protein
VRQYFPITPKIVNTFIPSEINYDREHWFEDSSALIYLLTEKQASNYCNTIEAGPSAATARGPATPRESEGRDTQELKKHKRRNIIEASEPAVTTRGIAPKVPRAQDAQEFSKNTT